MVKYYGKLLNPGGWCGKSAKDGTVLWGFVYGDTPIGGKRRINSNIESL